MHEIPPSLVQRGAVCLAEPEQLSGRDGMDARAEVAFSSSGELLVRTAGGLFTGPKVYPVAP